MVSLQTRKEKRRIKRFIKTGVHQARVYETTDNPNVYEYKTIHHIESHFYRKGRFGTLRRIR